LVGSCSQVARPQVNEFDHDGKRHAARIAAKTDPLRVY
jgi:hypothetical protein